MILLTWLPMAAALAQPAAAPQNVVNLSASAVVEVDRDWMSVTFSTRRDGADAGLVQRQLKQALDAALTEARAAARPGQLEVQTGQFSLQPRYTPQGAAIAGWQGTAELLVQGRDSQAIAQLSARIQTLTIARVAYSVSREARDKVDGEVSAMAVAAFRAKADRAAQQFGFSGWTLREVQLGGQEPNPVHSQPMRAQLSRGGVEEALPVEAGKALVTAVVSGSVQLQR
ncbi:MAG: SIMPL domain-containing protein [Opitutaceae bacterium]|nr:SIMPL domain-containing protein [Opitutaceae bacterium]